jgi:hypothetical protein
MIEIASHGGRYPVGLAAQWQAIGRQAICSNADDHHGQSSRHQGSSSVEHGKALQKRNRPRIPVFALCLLGLVLRGEAVRIANHRALFTAPDMAARRCGLPVGQPALGTVPAYNSRPQDQHIDARTGSGRHCVPRHRAGAPRRIQWQRALLQLRYPVVEVRKW